MKRREFITFLGGAAATWPLAARAQQSAMPVIGVLSSRTSDTDVHLLAVFRQGLKETGFVEGQNVAIEYRWTGGLSNPLPALAAELVRRQVAVVVTMGDSVGGARAVRLASSTTPIVSVFGPDPVKSGLVASFNRPGGNMTGIVAFQQELGAKKLELMRELVPNARIIASLIEPDTSMAEAELRDVQEAARASGRQFSVLRASTEKDIDTAFASLVQQKVGALLVGTSPFFFTRVDQIVALAAHHAVPTLYHRREFVDAGGLASYGSNTADTYRMLGIYTGRVLKGANAGELPVQLPTKFELVINLKTAKALGLDVPPSLLARADEVIE